MNSVLLILLEQATVAVVHYREIVCIRMAVSLGISLDTVIKFLD